MMPAMAELRSFQDLVGFLEKEKIPHTVDAQNFAVQIPAKAPAIPANVFVRWEQTIPYLQVMQQMSPPIPEDRIRELEVAVSRVNDVAMIPGYGFSYASKVLYYRLCVPVFDGISSDSLDKVITAVLNNAVQLQAAFRRVVEGGEGKSVLDYLKSS
jgi:hypothetical protein